MSAGPETCRVCGATEGHRRHVAREMMFGWRDPFPYLECGRCGCLQIEQVPADLARYYGEGYYSFGAGLDSEFADPTLAAARGESVRALLTLPEPQARAVAHGDMRRPLWALRRLGLGPDSPLLDVGCGAGRLLYLLRLAGWRALLGVDPFLLSDLSYSVGLQIRRAGLEAVEGAWDAIMFHHAFEHLADPAGTLRAVAARLAQHGTCLLRLPLADSDAWERYGVDWVQLDAPRHLFVHTRRSLELLAAQAGLRVVAVEHDSYALQFWGSEQYRRDIPLNAEGSYRWGGGAPIFTPGQIAAWDEEAEMLNRQGRGDQAAVYLEHA